MGLKVLIVDDAQFMRKVISDHIISLGHMVCGEAEDGEDALRKYIKLRPDCVTMDITMPKMDGIQAVSEIMKIDLKAKIIMCSAMGQKDMIVEAIKLGAVDFVVKPIAKERLKEALEKLKR